MSCSHFQSKQQVAESIVKKHLDSTLNDPSSYQSIKFEKLDTLRSTFLEEPVYKELTRSYDSLKRLSDNLSDKITITYSIVELHKIQKQNEDLYQKETAVLKKETDYMNSFKGKPVGWGILHTYRAKNGFGALTVGQTYFEIDSNITHVLASREIKTDNK